MAPGHPSHKQHLLQPSVKGIIQKTQTLCSAFNTNAVKDQHQRNSLNVTMKEKKKQH